MTCPICKNTEASLRKDVGDVHLQGWGCPQCGSFVIERVTVFRLNNVDDSLRWRVSAWLVQNAPATLEPLDIDAALAATPPSLHQRAMRMLQWLSNQYNAGQKFALAELGTWKSHDRATASGGIALGGPVTISSLMPIGWCRTIAEVDYMITEVLCNEMGLLQSQDKHEYQISPKGWLTLEGVPNSSSQIGFCAMWFNDDVKPLWIEVIEPAILESGYEALRIDGKPHNGKIDDEIMASIRASRFLVSDFTGNRGGVYYEAGFAHGLGLPVVFMCRAGDDLHFDVRQYNTIFWKPDQLQEAKSNLKNRILATLGKGRYGSNEKAQKDAF